MKIDVFSQLIQRRKRRTDGVAQAATIAVPKIWVVWLSLTNKESGKKPIRFDKYEDIRQSQQGDSDAYRRLIERHQGHVSKLLWRFTRDKNCHEELVQETFVQAYFSLGTYKSRAPFEHWLTRIATRVGYHFWRDQARHQHAEIVGSDWDNLAQSETEQPDPQEAAEFLHHLLAQLPARDRLVLTLRYLEQCDVAETARRTGWNPTMVKVQTHRAKQKLKKLAEKADMEIEI
ncbi:MAG: RNA polymerase sigma factor [Phycisphaerae bacterium]|nr:RNA polymerase sigma factor [Phycisphaerae bacterium]